MSRTLTLQEAADMLHVCPETVVWCINARGLPAAKIGRAWVLVDEDVIQWLRQQYREEGRCDSGSAGEKQSGGPISPSQGRELREALAPQTRRRRRNGPPDLRPISGDKGVLEKSPA